MKYSHTLWFAKAQVIVTQNSTRAELGTDTQSLWQWYQVSGLSNPGPGIVKPWTLKHFYSFQRIHKHNPTSSFETLNIQIKLTSIIYMSQTVRRNYFNEKYEWYRVHNITYSHYQHDKWFKMRHSLIFSYITGLPWSLPSQKKILFLINRVKWLQRIFEFSS